MPVSINTTCCILDDAPTFYSFLHILGFVGRSKNLGRGHWGVSESDQMRVEKCLHD